jgi:CubicO group peptidase (beta-lactamase class C family)
MTAPYACDDEPFQEMCMSPDWARFALDLLGGPMGPGTFRYSTAGAHLLSAIITRTTGMSAREFANQYLFGPIGMKTLPDYKITAANPMGFFQGRYVKGWVSDPAGNSAGGWGLTLTPRDMARFGYLYLNHGLWGQARIVPETWVGESTAMTPNNYGYLWWLFGGNKTNGSSIGINGCSNGTNGCSSCINGYAAMGDGGNIIFCSPEKDVVIAATASLSPDSSRLTALIMEEIIPMALASQPRTDDRDT